VQGVSAGKGALFDLFDRIESFFRRLEVYIGLPTTVEMTDTIVKVMAEVLRILALVTKEVKRGMISELILDDRTPPSTYYSSEKFFKKLVGNSDIEDALRRLENLTQEEHWMATAQNLRATHHVIERVMDVDNDVKGVDEKLQQVAIDISDQKRK
jgi:hypothetical protein